MKFLIAFILCFFCNSFETAAIYNITKNGIVATYSTTVGAPEKPTYRERVALKYLKLKAAKSTKKTRIFVAAIIFLALGIVLTLLARQSNQSQPKNGFTGSNAGCLMAVLALVSYATSLVLFIVALITSV
jgi:hypothetical protein